MISNKTLEQGTVEYKARTAAENKNISAEEAVTIIAASVAKAVTGS